MMPENYTDAREKAISELAGQIAFMSEAMAEAQKCGDMKGYCSIQRLFLPAQKEYLRLCAEKANCETTDALIDFNQGYNGTAVKA